MYTVHINVDNGLDYFILYLILPLKLILQLELG